MNTTQSINAAISLRILTFVALGWDVAEAFDAVLGSGQFRQVADSVWEASR